MAAYLVHVNNQAPILHESCRHCHSVTQTGKGRGETHFAVISNVNDVFVLGEHGGGCWINRKFRLNLLLRDSSSVATQQGGGAQSPLPHFFAVSSNRYNWIGGQLPKIRERNLSNDSRFKNKVEPPVLSPWISSLISSLSAARSCRLISRRLISCSPSPCRLPGGAGTCQSAEELPSGQPAGFSVAQIMWQGAKHLCGHSKAGLSFPFKGKWGSGLHWAQKNLSI